MCLRFIMYINSWKSYNGNSIFLEHFKKTVYDFWHWFYSKFKENFDVQIPKGGNLMLKGGAVLAVIAFIVTIVTTMCSRNAMKRAKED